MSSDETGARRPSKDARSRAGGGGTSQGKTLDLRHDPDLEVTLSRRGVRTPRDMKSTQDPVGSMEDQAGAARFMREEIETCWTLIRGAAIGRASDRSAFAKLYMPCVRAYLAARWRSTSLASEIEDVVQEVFIACLREGGVLEGADPDHPSGFRALLIRVTRNMALVTERDRGRRAGHMKDGHTALESTPVDEPSLSQAFDRAYARAIMAQARDQMAQRAAELGDRAERRVELLRMRFDDGLPIRLIA